VSSDKDLAADTSSGDDSLQALAAEVDALMAETDEMLAEAGDKEADNG
jgi:hypothetical protein